MSDPEPQRARAELVPDQFTLVARFDAVEKNLATIRNLIQGRTAVPIGSPALASRIGEAQEHWRAIRDKLLSDMLPHPYDSSETLEHWERLVNEIADAAIAEGIGGAEALRLSVTHTVTSPGDAAALIETRIERIGGDFLKGALIIVGGLGLIWVVGHLRR